MGPSLVSLFLVYGLQDPDTGAIRYVGQSSRGLARPKTHNEPKRNREAGNRHKAAWVAQVHARGSAVAIVVLEEFRDAADLNDAERFWIAQARGLGWPLTNLTSGGGGARGFKISAETIAKRRATRAANNHPPPVVSAEARQKLSAAHAGKPWSAERRAAYDPNRKLPTPSAESRNKMRLAKLGRKLSPSHKTKIAAGVKIARARAKGGA